MEVDSIRYIYKRNWYSTREADFRDKTCLKV